MLWPSSFLNRTFCTISVTMSISFVEREYSIWHRSPHHNRVWLSVVIITWVRIYVMCDLFRLVTLVVKKNVTYCWNLKRKQYLNVIWINVLYSLLFIKYYESGYMWQNWSVYNTQHVIACGKNLQFIMIIEFYKHLYATKLGR